MGAVMFQRNFALLWCAGLISVLGDYVLGIALPFYVYQQTGSALATGAMFMARTVPVVLLGSVAGVFVDRWSRRRTMVVCDVARAAVLLPLFTIRDPHWLWVLYFVAFTETAIGLFFGPAKSALIPRLVSADHLLAANSLASIGDTLPMLIGPALGGTLLLLLGLSSLVTADIASYLLSAALLMLIAIPVARRQDPAPLEVRPVAPRLAVWREWLEGLHLVLRDRALIAVFLARGLSNLGQGCINALIVVFVQAGLGAGAPQFGWLITAQGVGGLLAGLLVGTFGRLPPGRLLPLSLALTGLLIIGLVHVLVLPVALVLLALMGVPSVAGGVSSQTLLQRGAPDQFRGRISGAFGTVGALLFLAGQGVGSVLGNPLGVVRVFDLAGGLTLLAAAAAIALLWATPEAKRESLSTVP